METKIKSPQELYNELAVDHYHCDEFINLLAQYCPWAFDKGTTGTSKVTMPVVKKQQEQFLKDNFIDFEMRLPTDSMFIIFKSGLNYFSNSNDGQFVIRDEYLHYLSWLGWEVINYESIEHDKHTCLFKIRLYPINQILKLGNLN